jgi:hypothetical protein
MTRRREKAQQDELTAFVQALKDAAGYAHTSDWATESGYSYPNLTNLLLGKNGVDGYNLFRLIRAAAARMELPVETLAATKARAEDDLGEVLDQISAGVGEALTMLRALLEAQQAPPEGKRSRGARK